MIHAEPFIADTTIAAFRIVKFSATSNVTPATSVTDRLLGVSLGPGSVSTGNTVNVCMSGKCFLEVSGSVGRGAPLTTNASGQGVQAAPASGANNTIIAIALEGGTTGSIIPVFVTHGWLQG